jgi:hypothetical protein
VFVLGFSRGSPLLPIFTAVWNLCQCAPCQVFGARSRVRLFWCSSDRRPAMRLTVRRRMALARRDLTVGWATGGMDRHCDAIRFPGGAARGILRLKSRNYRICSGRRIIPASRTSRAGCIGEKSHFGDQCRARSRARVEGLTVPMAHFVSNRCHTRASSHSVRLAGLSRDHLRHTFSPAPAVIEVWLERGP